MTSTAVTRRPPAWRSAVSTIALEIESSCISSAASRVGVVGAQLVDRLEHEVGRALDGAGDLRRELEPHLLAAAGSQATTTTLPGQPPTVLTKRSTVFGSIPCGLTTSPSSIGLISSGSGSIT